MQITERHEQMVAKQRTARRQDKQHPLLIRDDGVLYPNVPLVAAKPNFRVYTGDPKASLKDRLQYIKMGGLRRVPQLVNTEPPPFDVGKATKEEILTFAVEEFGVGLDDTKPLARLREDLVALAKSIDGSA